VDDGLELDAPEEVLLVSPRSHAARPKASATATAKVESFMCPPWLGYEKESSKLRARRKPLMVQGPSRASGTLCRLRGNSYLPVLEPVDPEGFSAGFFAMLPEELEPLDPVLELPLEPEVPLAPDGLELPVAEVPPPEADLLPSLSHPASRVPLRANAIAAANAVNFMLTSMGCVPVREQGMDREAVFTKVVLYTDHDGRAKFREERVPLSEGTAAARLSALLPATGYQLRESPVGFASEFHCTPKPQWVFILQGEMQIVLQDGSARSFVAGQHFFSADMLPEGANFDPRVHGHRSAQCGAASLVTLFLKV